MSEDTHLSISEDETFSLPLRWVSVVAVSAYAFWAVVIAWGAHTVFPLIVAGYAPPQWLPTVEQAVPRVLPAVLLVVTVAGLREAGLLPDVPIGGGGSHR